MSWPQLTNLLQLLIWHVGFDFEIDPDSLVSVANVLIEFKKSAQINVAFQRGLNFFDVNAARRRVIDHGRSQTRGQGVEQMFDGVRGAVLAEQDRRLIGLEHKRLWSRLFLAGAVECICGRAVSAGVHPLVANAKFEFRDGGGGLDGIDGLREILNRDSVDGLCKHFCSCYFDTIHSISPFMYDLDEVG